MSTINRKLIFDAAKRHGAQFKSLAAVQDMDGAIDQAFVSVLAVDSAVQPAPARVGPALRAPAEFFRVLREGMLLGPTLSEDEVSGCTAIAQACAQAAWPVSWSAYAFGTAYLETAATMKPVKEANWLSGQAANRYFFRMYDIQGARPAKARELGNIHPGDGAKYCGRGYPQMTGRSNYDKADAKLHALGILPVGESLVDNPDLAMRPDIAAAIMVYGMAEGWFTGKKLADYLPNAGPATAKQFTPARRIINGMDRAGDVAAHALHFQSALIAGQWEDGS